MQQKKATRLSGHQGLCLLAGQSPACAVRRDGSKDRVDPTDLVQVAGVRRVMIPPSGHAPAYFETVAAGSRLVACPHTEEEKDLT